jgi:flagellar motility protein MotE (MotC chaperone)
LIRVLALIIFLLSSIYSQETSSSLTRQKLEVLELKKELTNFYEEKESEYQENKKELEDILTQIEKEKKEIKELHDKNALLLKEINLEIESKTAKIYNNLKAKSAATIFDNMIADGKVDDVFAIMLRIKEIQATQILKFLTVENSSLITHMLEEYKLKYGQKD